MHKLLFLQEILVVAIGKSVLRIDTTKVHKGVEFSAEEPFVCPLDKLINGVQLVGKHEGEVTDLSMCQWMTTRLVSASKDGTVCHLPCCMLVCMSVHMSCVYFLKLRKIVTRVVLG